MNPLKRSMKIMCSSLCLLSTLILSACNGSGTGGGTGPLGIGTGKASIHLTDAPNLNYDHVWITVSEIWFHELNIDDFEHPGWRKFPLATPVTIDLSKLSAGVTQEVWSGLVLPAGTYRQIRLFLVSTESAALPSLPDGNVFNNEVDYTDSTGVHKVPLRIPSPANGIKVLPEPPIVVSDGSELKLALDFNADEDVVQIFRQGQFSSAGRNSPTAKEFILKAHLRYFDMNNAAAITGTIAPPAGTFANFTGSRSFSNYTGNKFMIKAEQPNAAKTFRVVRHSSSVDKDGKFMLYPLPVFDNSSTANFDLVISGRNIDTQIIKGVKAQKGTTISNATTVSAQPITTVPNTSRFPVQVNVKPAGAWVSFYQNLPDDTVSYEILTSHIDPFNVKGEFATPVELSAGPLQVGAWNEGRPINFNTVEPVGGSGKYKAAASAFLYKRSAYMDVSSLTPFLDFASLTLFGPTLDKSISGNITVTDPGLNMGVMLITSGGMLVDNLDVRNQVKVGVNPYTTGNLPGGSPEAPMPDAYYDLFVLGWDAAQPNTSMVSGSATEINLKAYKGKADITLE